MKKLSWEFIERALPNVDHPALNGLRNSHGQKINVPVDLYKDGQRVLHADVEMYGSSMALYSTALWLTMQELEQSNIDLEWDKCSFLSGTAKFSKSDITNFSKDLLVPYMIEEGHDDVHSVFNRAGALIMKFDPSKPGDLKANIDEMAHRMVAYVVHNSAEVISDDITRHKTGQSYLKRSVSAIKNIIK